MLWWPTQLFLRHCKRYCVLCVSLTRSFSTVQACRGEVQVAVVQVAAVGEGR